MALATRCPHCETAFRVASDQLKLRAGLVRCGTCKEIFNGIENLLRPDEDINAALATSASTVPVLSSPVAAEDPERGDNTRFNDLIAEVDHRGAHGGVGGIDPPARTPDDAPQLPATNTQPEPEAPTQAENSYAARYAPVVLAPLPRNPDAAPPLPPPQPDGFPATTVTRIFPLAPPAEADDRLSDDAPTGAQEHEPGDASDRSILPGAKTGNDANGRHHAADAATDATWLPMPGLLRAASTKDVDDTLRRPIGPTRKPQPAEPVPDVAVEMPDFIARDQRRIGTERAARPLLWLLAAVLSLLLAGQLLYALRTGIAAALPQTRPLLDNACRMLGCSVGLPMEIESVSIESSDFQPVSGRPDRFLLTVLLRSRSNTVQAWPSIELTLNDANEKTVGRRVLLPREYLPAGQVSTQGFPAGSEQAVRLHFDLTRLKASGYRVYVFYP